jgi:hypothetical protein
MMSYLKSIIILFNNNNFNSKKMAIIYLIPSQYKINNKRNKIKTRKMTQNRK